MDKVRRMVGEKARGMWDVGGMLASRDTHLSRRYAPPTRSRHSIQRAQDPKSTGHNPLAHSAHCRALVCKGPAQRAGTDRQQGSFFLPNITA